MKNLMFQSLQRSKKVKSRRKKSQEYITKLKEKHGDNFTKFQYKLWADMLTSGVHTDINEPPAASTFSHEPKKGGHPRRTPVLWFKCCYCLYSLSGEYFEPNHIYKCTDTDEPSARFTFSLYSCNMVSIEMSRTAQYVPETDDGLAKTVWQWNTVWGRVRREKGRTSWFVMSVEEVRWMPMYSIKGGNKLIIIYHVPDLSGLVLLIYVSHLLVA